MDHPFGGPWTDDKLARIDKYLQAYMTIFETNPRAAQLETIYVDAFAGTGRRTRAKGRDRVEGQLFEDAIENPDAGELKEGSVSIALRQERPFDRYVFVDRDDEHARILGNLRHEYPHLSDRIDIKAGDANEFLERFCSSTDWRGKRAVVFLDPYGMQVDWTTIEAIAATKAIDLWLLFPLGAAVNRLLTTHSPPTGAHAERLTRIFGTEEWRDVFYRPQEREDPPLTLFEQEPGDPARAKSADFNAISEFFVSRLKGIFERVAEDPLPLTNSKNVPLYLLCFAAANPRGAPTAVNIANYVLKPGETQAS